MARRPATAAEVRSYLASQGVEVGSRGLLSAAQVTAFHKGNPGRSYNPGVAEGKRTTLTIRRNGRKATVTLPTSEVRAKAVALGQSVGLRGAVPAAAQAAVADSLSS